MKDSQFAWLLNARRREINTRAVVTSCLSREPILPNILEINEEAVDATSCRSFELSKRPTQHSQYGPPSIGFRIVFADGWCKIG
ncbi:MAG TPA: hypothetical protein VGK58_01425 [Lacipirellulaceae bacterium]